MLTVEFDNPVEPDLANFDLVGMEISDSRNWDIVMSGDRGLRIEERVASSILNVDLNRDHVTTVELAEAALDHLPVDFLARVGAFRDAAGSENLELAPADDMRITFTANGFILGKAGDVSGNGIVSSYDAALLLEAAVSGASTLPLAATAAELDAWLAAHNKKGNTLMNTADVNGDGVVNGLDAYIALRLAAGLTAPANLAADTKRCKLSVNNYDNGKLDLSIDVDNVKDVYCADIVMSYDPKLLTVTDVSKTVSTSGWLSADAIESGKLKISMAGVSQPKADGALVTIGIDAASADAITQLDIVKLELNGGRSRAEVENLPKAFALLQNYPNPFNPETWIPYKLSVPVDVTVAIYNVNGQMVRQLELGTKMPGSYVDRSKAAYWDGRNESGERVSSCIYFYQLRAGRDASIGKMIIVK
jgi:hypothetical protein